MRWNVLVVDDHLELAENTASIIQSSRTIEGEDFVCEIVSDFEVAKSQVLKSKFDLAILDLRDDGSDDDLKGKEILDYLREVHFLPIIFYSGFAEKVRSLETPLVRVVVKGDNPVAALRGAVKEIFDTGLPQLIRYIHDQQRNYLWSHVDNFWKDTAPLCEPEDLAYLLARRLGNALRSNSIRGFLKSSRGDADVVHPIEMYVWPPIGDDFQTGDLLRLDGKVYVLMNPACDFAQGKIDYMIMAECVPLTECVEYVELAAAKTAGALEADPKKIGALKSLVGDNRAGKRVQPDRYKFLPKTVFLDGHVVDFQRLRTAVKDDENFSIAERIATLDTPFVESLLNKFSRYYGRIGTPNLESSVLSGKIVSEIWSE